MRLKPLSIAMTVIVLVVLSGCGAQPKKVSLNGVVLDAPNGWKIVQAGACSPSADKLVIVAPRGYPSGDCAGPLHAQQPTTNPRQLWLITEAPNLQNPPNFVRIGSLQGWVVNQGDQGNPFTVAFPKQKVELVFSGDFGTSRQKILDSVRAG